MIDFISDAIAYCIIGVLSFYQHIFFWIDDNWDPTQQDRIDEATEGNYVARWRYRMNQMLGGHQTKQYYIETSAKWQGCAAGCGCLVFFGLLLIAGIMLVITQ